MLKRNFNIHLYQRFKLWSTDHQYHTAVFSDQNLITLLQSCNQPSQSAQIHGLMIKSGLENIPFLLSKLLACCSLQDIHYAASIFGNIKNPNLYMCNSMLRGYSISDVPKMGLVLFNLMMGKSHRLDFLLDQFTFVSVLKSCARLFSVQSGIGVHGVVLKYGFHLFLNVMNTLLHFYCVCGRISHARQLFDELGQRRDLVSWNILIGGYLCVSQFSEIVELFRKLCRDGFRISVTTILGVLSAIGGIRNVSLGKCLHVFCLKVGFNLDLNVASALISMYGKHGYIGSMCQIFDEMDVNEDIVLWNCLIDGYSKTGRFEEALELVWSMEQHGVKPNSSTLAGFLSDCTASAAYNFGHCVHDYVKEQQVEIDEVLGTALIDMYAKSASLEKAVEVFDEMERKDVRSWTAMISGYGFHGQAAHAIMLFYRMEEEGFVPNEVTFLAVLSSCSHGGMVMEGMSLFRRMVTRYGLRPNVEHYGCMIDLLGRAGSLEEAYDLIKGLPVEMDATAWRALLGACRVYGYVDLVGRVEQELDKMCHKHPADLLSVIGTCAAAGLTPHYTNDWERKYQLTKKANSKQSGKKEAGCSMIELS